MCHPSSSLSTDCDPCRVSSLTAATPPPELEFTATGMYIALSNSITQSPQVSIETFGETELGNFILVSPIMVSDRMSFWPPVVRTSSLTSMRDAVSSPLRFWKR